MKLKQGLHALIIILTFLIAVYGKNLLHGFVEFQFYSYAMRIIYSYSWWVVPVMIATAMLYSFRNVLKALGLQKGFLTERFSHWSCFFSNRCSANVPGFSHHWKNF